MKPKATHHQHFLSLRWKLLLILFIVSAVIGIASSYYFQHQLLIQFDQARKEAQLKYTRQINGLIGLDVERVRQLTATLPTFISLNNDLMEYASPAFYRYFDNFWSNFQIDMGVNDAKLYAPDGHIIASWGNDTKDNLSVQSRSWKSNWEAILSTETSSGLIECAYTCSIYAFAPILKKGETIGVFSIGASLADAVLSFQKTSKADVAIVFSKPDAGNIGKSLWGMHIAAASNPEYLVPLITRAAKVHTFSELSKKPIRYAEADHIYEISLVKLEQSYWTDGMQMIVVEDISPDLAIVQQNSKQIMVFAMLATVLILSLLYFLLSIPLKRLRRIASSMPLLGQGAFQELRSGLRPHRHQLTDEMDVLDQSTLDLSNKLESLEHEVVEKTLSLKNLFNEVLREKEFATKLLNQAEAIIATITVDGRILSINQFGLTLTGKNKQELMYADLSEIDLTALKKKLAEVANTDLYNYAHESVLIAADRSPRNISWVHTRLQDDIKGDTILLSVGMDITERIRSQEVIHHLANYDALTNLPNRRLLIDRLKHALSSSTRSGQHGALLFIDLDNFKSLNDTLGHKVGDILLQEVAKRLTVCIREGDTVSRIGSDEFIVVLEDLSNKAIESAGQAEHVARKIQHKLNQPFQLKSHSYQNTVSIGISLFSDHDKDTEELLKQVDIASNQAKRNGNNSICFYDPKMQESLTAHVTLERELNQAIIAQQFILYYQIQVDNTGKALGAEVLIRWQHPQRGMVSPYDFIPLAEETGLIIPIGKWVLDNACAQLSTWQKSEHTRYLSLSVNVTAQQFLQNNFAAQVESAIRIYAIDPALLKLELTESMLVNELDKTIATMHALQKIGIKFSLDDFGTGYSSLQYLKRLPIYQLKIDQSFVHDLANNVSDQAIVRTIIAMAQTLNLNVIAEGVETAEQRQLLLDNGCYCYQGYLFGKPLPIDAFEALLKESLIF